MASLYKKPIVKSDPKTGRKIKSKSKKWWGRYRDVGDCERRVPLASDKSAAQTMLNSKHHSNTAARHRLHFAGGNVQRS